MKIKEWERIIEDLMYLKKQAKEKLDERAYETLLKECDVNGLIRDYKAEIQCMKGGEEIKCKKCGRVEYVIKRIKDYDYNKYECFGCLRKKRNLKMVDLILLNKNG